MSLLINVILVKITVSYDTVIGTTVEADIPLMTEPSIKNISAKEQGSLALGARWLSILVLSTLAGIEAAMITNTLKNMIIRLSNFFFNAYPERRILLAVSTLSGISILLFMSLVVFIPMLWRKVVGISFQRAIIYTTIQLFGISLGLIGLNRTFSFWLTFVLVFAGTRTWWSVERSWRGVGHSPSLRSGIMKPHIHSGQLWFAYVPGNKETKNRPIMVLKQTDNRRWLVAYYTTQAPRYTAQEKYFIEIKSDNIRGMEKNSWINISDIKALKKNQFRTYVGLAPEDLYNKVCVASNVAGDPLAWTINESVAGGSSGPIELGFRRAIGLTHAESSESQHIESLRDVIKSFISIKVNS